MMRCRTLLHATQQKLDPSEYMPHAPEHTGTTVCVGHEGCENANRKRLYITRKADGVLAFCHNCGLAGYTRGKGMAKAKRPRRDTVAEKVELPSPGTYDWGQWPPKARGWLRKYGVTEAVSRSRCVLYASDLDRVVLPYYHADGTLVLWQGRYLGDHKADKVPKYLTCRRNDYPCVWFSEHGHSKRMVVVEDILSGIRIGSQEPCAALLSTGCNERGLLELLKRADNFVVWLDDDAHDKAQKLAERISVVAPCRMVRTPLDPKCYTDNEIRVWLRK